VRIYRRAARVDISQEGIVRALRDADIRVFPIGRPCDLLVQFWCHRHGVYCWQTLECKTAGGSGKPRKRNDQEEQDKFLALTNTPIVTSFDEAWQILNTRHHLGQKPV
jgi:hypothetical protein